MQNGVWRQYARTAHALVGKGKAPIAEQTRQRRRSAHSLTDVSAECFELRKVGLKNDGKAASWMLPFEDHNLSKLGRVPIFEFDQVDINHVLSAIRSVKPEAG